MNYIEALLLSFIEGLTEFLPISSTGHLILTSATIGISEDGFVKAFNIIIQFGAIASVLVLYWKRFLPDLKFYKKIFIAFLPSAIIGLAIKNKIDLLLGSVLVVAIAFIVGGVILIWTDLKLKKTQENRKTIDTLDWKTCFFIGLIQCLAFIPGISRAGATIVGGLFLGMDKKEATEFSFFLAVPTLTGASLVKSLQVIKMINSEQIGILIFGTVFSFIFALMAIKVFIRLVSKYGFKHFGYYRILVGIIILFLSFGGKT